MLTPFTRKLKQGNVFLSWIIFLLVIIGSIWLFLGRPEPQGEIKSLKVENVRAILKEKEKKWEPPFTYKVLADIINPNENFNAKKVNYIFEIKDKNQKVMIKKEGKVEEVRAQERKIIEEEVTLQSAGENFSFQLLKAKWERIAKSK